MAVPRVTAATWISRIIGIRLEKSRGYEGVIVRDFFLPSILEMAYCQQQCMYVNVISS